MIATAGCCAARIVGMRKPSDDELAAFDAVTFQHWRFPRSVQNRFR
jgi:hypothetical protein